MTAQLLGFGSLLPGEFDRAIDGRTAEEVALARAETKSKSPMEARGRPVSFSKTDFEALIKRGDTAVGIASYPNNDWLGPTAALPPLDSRPPTSSGHTGRSGHQERPDFKPRQRTSSSGATKVCGNCGTSVTPLWRKEGGVSMCNACGIYFKNHGYHRPVKLILGPSSRQQSSQGGGGTAGGGRGSRLGTPATSVDMGHGVLQLDTATSHPDLQSYERSGRSRRGSDNGGRGKSRRVEREGLDTFVRGTSAEGSAMEGAYAHGPGNSSDAAGEDGARRSRRRHVARPLGEEWAEPDEVITPAGATARSQLGAVGRRVSHTGTECESNHKRSRGLFLKGTPPASPSWEGGPAFPLSSLSGGVTPSHSPAQPTSSHANATTPSDPLLASFDLGMGSGPAATPCHDRVNRMQGHDRPHLPLSKLGKREEAPLGPQGPVGPILDQGPDLVSQDDSSKVADTLVRLRRHLLRYWASEPSLSHDLNDKHSLAQDSFAPSPVPSSNIYPGLDQEVYPSDSHTSDCATESTRLNAANRRKQSQGKSRKRAGSSNRASPTMSRGSVGASGNHVCFNCGTSKTPLWRKDRDSGETMCNACGIYKQTHGYPRPVDVSMRSDSPSRALKRLAVQEQTPEPDSPTEPPSPSSQHLSPSGQGSKAGGQGGKPPLAPASRQGINPAAALHHERSRLGPSTAPDATEPHPFPAAAAAAAAVKQEPTPNGNVPKRSRKTSLPAASAASAQTSLEGIPLPPSVHEAGMSGSGLGGDRAGMSGLGESAAGLAGLPMHRASALAEAEQAGMYHNNAAAGIAAAAKSPSPRSILRDPNPMGSSPRGPSPRHASHPLSPDKRSPSPQHRANASYPQHTHPYGTTQRPSSVDPHRDQTNSPDATLLAAHQNQILASLRMVLNGQGPPGVALTSPTTLPKQLVPTTPNKGITMTHGGDPTPLSHPSLSPRSAEGAYTR
eukprot:gene31115-6247_t